MAVPSSGELSLARIRMENEAGDYTIGPYTLDATSLASLMAGTSEWGDPPSNPGAPHAMSEFYSTQRCFALNTKVLMGDGSFMNIQDVKVGNLVETIDGIYPVLKTLSHIKNNEQKLFSINDNDFFVTDNHPFMTKDGWKSLKVNDKIKDYMEDTPLQIGDFIQTTKGWVGVKKIQKQKTGKVNRVYNLSVDVKESYFANNYLVHNKCFVGDTLITMADGTYRPIENIKVEDLVFTQNGNEKVNEVVSPIHNNIVELMFSNGNSTKNTDDHPYYVIDKGWCSIKPKLSTELYDVKCEQLEVSDIFIDDEDVQIKLLNIERVNGEFKTYTFSTDSKTYYANKLLVHSEI